MLSFERKYRVRGGTLDRRRPVRLLGGAVLRRLLRGHHAVLLLARDGADRLWSASLGPTWNLWQISIAPPGPEIRAGPGAAAAKAASGRSSPSARSVPSSPGRCARSRSAASSAIGYHVPFAFGVAIFAYVSLVVIRPLLMGAWGHGFPYGIISHLDWVSNTGYQYLHFHYNPAHMLAVSFFFTTDVRARAAWRAGPVGDQPGQGRDGQDRRAREHVLPRHHRLLDRHAGHPPARAVPGALRRVLERRLHHHQRPVLDARLAGMVDLVARSADLALGRGHRHGRISEHLHPRADPRPGLCRCATEAGHLGTPGGPDASPTLLGRFGDAQIGPIYLGCVRASRR